METLSFNEAHETDIPAVSEILGDATRHKLKHGDTIWGHDIWSDQEIKDSMRESTMYVVHQNGEAIGTVSLQWEDEQSWGVQPPVAGYLHRLAIKDGYHGQGLGEAIVDWALTQTAQNGREFLRLDCEESNTLLCAYYEKLGFIKVGSRAIPEHGTYVAALYERVVDRALT